MASSKILQTILSLVFIIVTISAHNITEILEQEPDLSEFNRYLSETKLADDINSRTTITVLALTNSAVSSFVADKSMAAIKNILSLHILLDYYDSTKLHGITGDQATCTNLYQTTGLAMDQIGQINITLQKKTNVVGFGSGQPGSKTVSKFVKEIRIIPFTISVLLISDPIIVPSLLTSGPIDTNVSKILYDAHCTVFADMLMNSGVGKSYQAQILDNGITIFAPSDAAFKAKNLPNFSKLNNADLVALLQYHALNSYMPSGTLKLTKGDLKTLAPAGKYRLNATSSGDTITLHTGLVNSRVAKTVSDSAPTVIFSVDSVLLPEELFGKKSVAPTPAPEISPAPTPANSPPFASPPAPPTPADDTGSDDPADNMPAPSSDEADDTKSASARGIVVPVMMVVVTVVCGVILF